MTAIELLRKSFESELKGTRTSLERVPAGEASWKPHEKSMPLGRLAMHVAQLPIFGAYILTETGLDMSSGSFPKVTLDYTSTPEMVETLDRNAARLREVLQSTSDADLDVSWPFSFGPSIISNAPRGSTYTSVFFTHMLHHRAQLGVYLRLLDIPVPGLYGPSADESL